MFHIIKWQCRACSATKYTALSKIKGTFTWEMYSSLDYLHCCSAAIFMVLTIQTATISKCSTEANDQLSIQSSYVVYAQYTGNITQHHRAMHQRYRPSQAGHRSILVGRAGTVPPCLTLVSLRMYQEGMEEGSQCQQGSSDQEGTCYYL